MVVVAVVEVATVVIVIGEVLAVVVVEVAVVVLAVTSVIVMDEVVVAVVVVAVVPVETVPSGLPTMTERVAVTRFPAPSTARYVRM